MSTISNEAEKPFNGSQSGPKSRQYRKLFIVVGGIAVILVTGLSLGLGLGLGLHKSTNSSTATIGSATVGSAITAIPRHRPGSNSTTWSDGTTWQPAVGTTFNYQLLVVPTSDNPYDIGVWFIDLFDSSTDLITGLQGNGAKVVCYFSAGSYEPRRPDSNQFLSSDIGANLTGWPGERWVNTKSAAIRSIMAARIEQAALKKCDGVDPDNMDAYDNDGGGFDLTEDDAEDYAKYLASEASSHGLSIGLKNAGAIIPKVIDVMQWSVNEQCVNLTECHNYTAFINASKPVFNIEYPKGEDINNNDPVPVDQLNEICDQQANDDVGFSTILKNMNLNPWIEFCNGTSTVLS